MRLRWPGGKRAVLLVILAGLWLAVRSAGAAPPSALTRFEASLEDSFDLALANHVREPVRLAGRLTAEWDRCRALLIAGGLDSMGGAQQDIALRQLAGVAGKNPGSLELARAINGCSAHLDALFAPYHPREPSPLLRLDYLGRELDLDGRAADLLHARQTLAELGAFWSAFKPEVVRARGARVARLFDLALAAATGGVEHGDAATIRKAARRTLELVDRCERLF